MSNICFNIFVSFLISSALCSITYSNELISTFKLPLSSSEFLTITIDDKDCYIAISENNRAHQLASVKNAATSQSSVKVIKFCHDCEDSYFIPAWDLGSTYGATTGIIAWQDDNYSWWLIVLPFSVADIEDFDNDGVYELVDQYAEGSAKFKPVKKSYQFSKGLICPK